MTESFVVIANQYPWLFYSFVVIASLCIGSFLNVVIIRIPMMMERQWQAHCQEIKRENVSGDVVDVKEKTDKSYNIATPRSHCQHCGYSLKIWENIPLISFIFLRGKCAACGGAISLRYPFVELLTTIMTVFVVWHFGLSMQMVAALLLTWVLIALSLIDYDTQLLPDSMTLPLVWLGLLVNISATFTVLSSAVLGAVIGYLSLWSIYYIFKYFTGKEGLGFGDFKLLAALGAWFGWQQLAIIIFLSSFAGAIIGILLILLGKQTASKPIPFGPYLALAGWVSMIWGENIVEFYLNVAGLS